eukprot:1507245-Pleurochrysis_carterae.AAC.1
MALEDSFRGAGQRGLATGAGAQARVQRRRQPFGQAKEPAFNASSTFQECDGLDNARAQGILHHSLHFLRVDFYWSQTLTTWGRKHRSRERITRKSRSWEKCVLTEIRSSGGLLLAERTGTTLSRVAAFTIKLSLLEPLMDLLSLCDAHPQARYSISSPTCGNMKWVNAPSIDSHVLPAFVRAA